MNWPVAIASLVLLLPATSKAQEKTIELTNIQVKSFQARDLQQRNIAVRKFEVRRSQVSRSEAAIFYGTVMCLWTATTVDIHTTSVSDRTRFREASPFGRTSGQVTTSVIATGAALVIRHYAKGRLRWLAPILLAGATAGHTYAAVHNYGLR